MKVLRATAIHKRMLEAFPDSTVVIASEKVAHRLIDEGISVTGRTIRSYTQQERRPTEAFCLAFSAAFGPFENDEWIDRKNLARANQPDRASTISPIEMESRRLQLLINRFCGWCAGGDDAEGKQGRCPDATCVLRPASPLSLASNARENPVASADRWD